MELNCGGGCCIVLDDYLFDFSRVAEAARKARPAAIVLEAPQGMVRLLERLASFLTDKCLDKEDVDVYIRLEPSFGSCSLSLDVVELVNGNSILVHIGHGEYVYPLCAGGVCSRKLPRNVYLVEAEYLGGDAELLAHKIVETFSENGWSSTAIGHSIQHKRLAEKIAVILADKGIDVVLVDSLLGCYYYRHVKLRENVDAYIVVAGGYFHALGLGLALAGAKPVLRVDPYTSSVEDISGLVARTLAKRYWVMRQAVEASRFGIVLGLLPGQYRPWIAEHIARLVKKHGGRYRFILARYVTREYLDNLSPGDYDVFVMVSCPRLAIEDLSDYWKPVLTPAEARIVLSGDITSSNYTFPW